MRPSPSEVKCDRSSLLVILPRLGFRAMWARSLEKMKECGMVTCLYSIDVVTALNVRDVRRQETRSTLRGVYSAGGTSRAS